MSSAPTLETESSPREAIMEAAMQLFGKQGYTGTSMRDIASAVGLLPGSLYAHIDSKEALLVDIIEDGIGRFIAAVTPHVRSAATPAEKLRAMVVAHVTVVGQNPERSLVVFHQWRFLGANSIAGAKQKRRDYEEAFQSVISEGAKTGAFRADLDIRITVFSILGALNWTPEWLSLRGKLSPKDIGDRMAETLLSGLLIRAD